MRTPAQVLTEVKVSWDGQDAHDEHHAHDGHTTGHAAFLIHAAPSMLVLEARDPTLMLPAAGTPVTVDGLNDEPLLGRIAEHGRAGRFLVSLGGRPVRRASRLRVSLPATLRSAQLGETREVEIVDLTTGGARVRGVQLPVGAGANLHFTPPGREEPVTVHASVVHAGHAAGQPWVGLAFRLVALRGGRA